MKTVHYGSVCKDLLTCRVYEKPSILSGLVTYLYPGDIVTINDEDSTDCYYKVVCKNGLIGYCLRPHIDSIEKEYNK